MGRETPARPDQCKVVSVTQGIPANRGTIRAIPVGRVLTRRVTPSGGVRTRRSARRRDDGGDGDSDTTMMTSMA